jgi:cellulose synthase operon protein C
MHAAVLLFALSASQLPGQQGFRSAAQQRQEFVNKLRRDIAKVAHSVEVTQELIGRSRGAPFLPDIYLRLAELYVEQARYEFYLVHELRGESSKGSVVAPTAKLLKEKAVETYSRILQDWPEFKDNDKVLFYLGHEYRELGRYDDLIARYEELVTKHPKSELVLDAYLVLGDHRFDKQDLVGAKRYYQKILDSPPDPVHDLAHFKMGWVFLNESDYKEALHHFEAAVKSEWQENDGSGSRRDQQRLVNVKREALIDLAYAYTEVRKPKGALRYFRELAQSRNVYLLALEKLGRRYFVKQDFNASATVYREIARLSHDAEENLDSTNRIYAATKQAKNYRLVHIDTNEMLRALDGYRFDWRVPKAQRDAAANDFEQYTRDLATRAQADALEGDKEILPRVALAYQRYLESFPDNAHHADIVENLADTLFEAKLYAEAGDRYQEGARLAKDDKAKEESLYNACVAFHEGLKNLSKMDRFGRIWAQQGLIRNGVAYVEAFPTSQKVPQIKLNIGRSYYEGGDFERAIGVFDEFIATYPTHPSATAVADLILDSYAQQQNYAKVAERAKQLAAIANLGDAAFRERLVAVAKGAEERQIGEVILTASIEKQAGGNAGEQLKKYWEENKSSPVAEKTLYTAFVQYKEARDFDKTFELGNQFIGAYPKSEYLGDVFGTLAAFTTQTGEYEQAAVYLEEFYKRFPTDPSAQRMLSQSATIKQLIGDHRGAITAYRELIGAVKDRELKGEYASKMLSSYEALNDWDGMQAAADSVLATNPEDVKAQLMVGLSAQKSGDFEAAIGALQAAVTAAGRSSSEDAQADAARAAFSLGDTIYRQFEKVGVDGSVTAAAEQKAQLLGELEAALVEAVGFNRGEWAVAALHRAGLAYANFGKFLRQAPPPEGIAGEQLEQYKAAVDEQAKALEGKAEEFFTTCLSKARELNVFTGAVLGCVEKTDEKQIPALSTNGSAPPKQKQEELKAALLKNPKDLDAIAALADYFLQSKQPAKAKLMAARGLEIDERDARFHNKIGMAELLLGHAQDAFFGFQRAAELKHPYAQANMIALMVAFKDMAGAKKLAKSIDGEDIPNGAADLHPEAPSAYAQVAK